MGSATDPGRSYGNVAGFVFVFNLVVGIGGLALPLSFSHAGMVLGSLFLCLMGFLSYITVTFTVEAQAAANALLVVKAQTANNKQEEPLLPVTAPEDDEHLDVHSLQASVSPYAIKQRTELGLMSELFLGRRGVLFFYGVMVLYLYGDLTIYAASVPLTLEKYTGPFSIGSFEVEDAYRFYVVAFAVVVVPFCFFNFQGTAWSQYITMATRNIAFFMMIILGFIRVANGKGANTSKLALFRIQGIPDLFGTAVYSFMCHHSLPSIVSPIRDKRSIASLFAADYLSIFLSYLLLCVSAVLAYGEVDTASCSRSDRGQACRLQQLYTLNFESYGVQWMADYLTLFPVFTLTTNFPLIAITLRNNLQIFFISMFPQLAADAEAPQDTTVPFSVRVKRALRRNLFALMAVGPPIVIALFTHDVDTLVSFTGSFAGLFIQFVIPTCLVYYARRHPLLNGAAGPHSADAEDSDQEHSRSSSKESYGSVDVTRPGDATKTVSNADYSNNEHKSYFQHPYWLQAMAVFSAITFCMNVYNQIRKYS